MTRLPFLRAALTLIFLYFGGRKLIGHPLDLAIYEAIGFGQWPRPITGTVEVLGAIGLWLPGAQAISALVLTVTMVTGFLALSVYTTEPSLHLIVLALACGTVVLAYRDQLTRR